MNTFYQQPTRRVNPATQFLTEVAKRVDRGHNLPADGYKFFGTPFAPSTYVVLSPKGFSYTVTIDTDRQYLHCTCEDYAHNGLGGICKHICGVNEYRETIDAEGMTFSRNFYRSSGQQVVRAHVRNGKRIEAYVRTGRLTSRIPDAVIEAQCAEYDDRHSWAA